LVDAYSISPENAGRDVVTVTVGERPGPEVPKAGEEAGRDGQQATVAYNLPSVTWVAPAIGDGLEGGSIAQRFGDERDFDGTGTLAWIKL
jgi:hypothetical protein